MDYKGTIIMEQETNSEREAGVVEITAEGTPESKGATSRIYTKENLEQLETEGVITIADQTDPHLVELAKQALKRMGQKKNPQEVKSKRKRRAANKAAKRSRKQNR